MSRKLWTPQEDELLRAARDGARNKSDWQAIAQGVPGRSGKSCSERWRNHLNPNVLHVSFTAWEVAVVVMGQQHHGNNWAAISMLLLGRTNRAVKNLFVGKLKGARLPDGWKRHLKAAGKLVQDGPAATAGSPQPPAPATPPVRKRGAPVSPSGSPAVGCAMASQQLTASPASGSGSKRLLRVKRRSPAPEAPATPELRRLDFGRAHATAAAATHSASPFALPMLAPLGAQPRVAALNSIAPASHQAMPAAGACGITRQTAAAWPGAATLACHDGAQQAVVMMDCDGRLSSTPSLDIDGVLDWLEPAGLPGHGMELDALATPAAGASAMPASMPAQQSVPVVAAPVLHKRKLQDDGHGEDPPAAKRARRVSALSLPLVPPTPAAGGVQVGSFGATSSPTATSWHAPALAPCMGVPDAAAEQALAALLQPHDSSSSELSIAEFALMARELGLLGP